jgi:hypothetical protein
MRKTQVLHGLLIGAIIIVVLYLLRSENKTTQEPSGDVINNITMPAFDLPPRGEIVFPDIPGYAPINISYGPVNLPGLPSSNFYSTNYDMRSACMCGGSSVPYYQTQSAPPPPPPVTYAPQPSSGSGFNFWVPAGNNNPYDPSINNSGWLMF